MSNLILGKRYFAEKSTPGWIFYRIIAGGIVAMNYVTLEREDAEALVMWLDVNSPIDVRLIHPGPSPTAAAVSAIEKARADFEEKSGQ